MAAALLSGESERHWSPIPVNFCSVNLPTLRRGKHSVFFIYRLAGDKKKASGTMKIKGDIQI